MVNPGQFFSEKRTWDIDHNSFSRCWLLYAFSNHKVEKITLFTDQKEMVSPQYRFFYASLSDKLQKRTWDIDHKEMVSLQCGLLYVSLNNQLEKITQDITGKGLVSTKGSLMT